MKPTTYIDLFSGVGGASLGLLQAGYRCTGSVELDPKKCQTQRLNLGHPVYPTDVRAYHGPPNPTILWASPPCQPFSRAGLRLGVDDPRNLWPQTLEQCAKLRPTWLLAENVVLSDTILEPLIDQLNRLFSRVSTRVVDVADYGLPQSRPRQILVAGPKRYRWPKTVPRRGAQTVLDLGHPALRAEQQTAKSRSTELPSPTVTTAGNLYTAPKAGVVRGDFVEGRRLEPEECALLQGFPRWFKFYGNKRERYRMVGDAVPPVLSFKLARGIL